MNQYLLTAVFDVVLATIALTKKDNLAARALAYTLFSASIWSMELLVLSSMTDTQLLDPIFHITRWGMFFIPPSFALLVWRLNGSCSRVFLRAVVIPGFVMSAALSLSNLFFFPTSLISTPSGYLPEIDAVYFGFVVCFMWCYVGSIWHSVYRYRIDGTSLREKQRIKWLLITSGVVFFGGVFNLISMPRDFYLSRYIGSIINVLFVGCLFYSTIQHRLMDFRSALSVGLSRALLLGFIVWSLFLVMSLLGPFEKNSGDMFVFVLLMVVSLEVYPRLLQWVLPNTKRLLSGDSYEFDQIKPEFQKALNDCVSLGGALSVMDFYLGQKMKIANYSILLSAPIQESIYSKIPPRDKSRKVCYVDAKDDLFTYITESEGLVMVDETPENIQRKLKIYNAQLGFSVRFGVNCSCLILIGPVKHYAFYRYDDIRLFDWLRFELHHVFNRISQIDEMQNQLAQAKKTLSMLSVMNHYHHDIKAPLAIIDGVLSNDIYDREKQKDIVLQQVERGSRLIATMASLLKGERKRNVQPVSLSDVVQDSLFLFNKGVDEVKYNFVSAVKILGDAEDLKILVINVVKNALEARRDKNEIHVEASTWETSEYICLGIADTGSGMSETQLASLWDESTSFKSRGNGIGMQAIKRIADEHMAEIDVVSEVGKGTEFNFKFPITLVVRDGSENITQDQESLFSDRERKPLAG